MDDASENLNFSPYFNTSNETIKFKEMFTKSVTKELSGHKKRVYTLDWNSNGKY